MKNADFWARASRLRLWIAIGIALLLLIILPHGWPGELRGLVAWNGAVACFLALAWRVILISDAARTRRLCQHEDENRPMLSAILISASFASMGGVLLALSQASDSKSALAMHLTIAAIATVVLSWLLVHTLYAFHYARLYYEGKSAGTGINFHCDDPPDYLDFCYLSFAVGTTFGATDSEIGGRKIRRTILKHGVLSFTFATVIVALTLSVISSLLGGS